MDDEMLFLSREQAIKAICLDFRGYPVQTMLFSEILRTLFWESITYKRFSDPPGLWVSESGGNMRRLEGDDLKDFMCRLISRARIPLESLTTLCRLVFQTDCQSKMTADGEEGVAIRMQMAGFVCRQCGLCCRELDYSDGITAQDVERLRSLGRKDILEWVGISRDSDGRTIYRMWLEPGTNQRAAVCPFLKQGPSPDRFVCTIHDVKPDICRNFPVSRKHAVMTGCPGFDR